MGSRGAAQPREVGQPKPSISSAARQSKRKERERERERAGKTGTEKATERKKEKPETNVPFLPSNQDENSHTLATQNVASKLFCDQKDGDFPRRPHRHGSQNSKWQQYYSWMVVRLLEAAHGCACGCIFVDKKPQVIPPLIQTCSKF